MTNIVVMGECMVEFLPLTEGEYKQSFAGDVYNTAVYLKRLLANASKVSLLTAVGKDLLSQQMIQALAQENINTEFVEQLPHQQIGAYLIKTSAEGERSFVYWRDSSAAKSTLSFLNATSKKKLISQTDIFYFSGISLAILNPLDRQIFWQLLEQLKNSGVQIVFDSNYRAKLWQNSDETKSQFAQAFRYANVVFPGVEDFELLYGFGSFDAIEKYLAPFEIDEIIIKNGANSMMCVSKGKSRFIPVAKVNNVVDTTSAGDSFNAGYLAAKQIGYSLPAAVGYAAKIAAIVIQHHGAIVASDKFEQLIKHMTFTQNEELALVLTHES